MTVSYPYSLPFFADKLHIESVIFDVQRNDELSGTGDGRILAAELAPPIWTADVTLAFMSNDFAKQTAARIRKLNGAQQAFFLYDPTSKYPQYDPDGSKLGAGTQTITSIGADRSSISVTGLPANFKLTTGDKLQITDGITSKTTFHEVSEDITASAGGVTAVFALFPHLPTWVATPQTVLFSKPACRCIIMPGSFKSGQATINGTTGAAFKAIQRK